MPRIRSIKPECLQHRKVGRLSDRCVRVWLGMLTHADDEGRLPCDAGEVLGWCGFSYHRAVTEDHVEEAIQLLQKTRLIQIYSTNGTRYAWFPSWKDHQVISHPAPSKLPPPPEPSMNAPEDSGVPPEPSILIGSDLIRSDRKGSERKGVQRETTGGLDSWPDDWAPIRDKIRSLPWLATHENWVADLSWWQTLDEWLGSCPKRLDALLTDAIAYISSTGYEPRTKKAMRMKIRNCLNTAGRIAEHEAQRRETHE